MNNTVKLNLQIALFSEKEKKPLPVAMAGTDVNVGTATRTQELIEKLGPEIEELGFMLIQSLKEFEKHASLTKSNVDSVGVLLKLYKDMANNRLIFKGVTRILDEKSGDEMTVIRYRNPHHASS